MCLSRLLRYLLQIGEKQDTKPISTQPLQGTLGMTSSSHTTRELVYSLTTRSLSGPAGTTSTASGIAFAMFLLFIRHGDSEFYSPLFQRDQPCRAIHRKPHGTYVFTIKTSDNLALSQEKPGGIHFF